MPYDPTGEWRPEVTPAAARAAESLALVEEDGVRALEGVPGARPIATRSDLTRVLERCFATRTRALLLHAENLPEAFFGRAGDAGSVLERLASYGIRLAVVLGPAERELTSRLGQLLAEPPHTRHFGVFATREAARAWLADAEP